MARGVPAQDALARTPLWSRMMKVFPSGKGHQDPKACQQEQFRMINPVPCSIDLSTIRWSLHSLTGKFSFTCLIHFRSHKHTDFFPLHIEPNPPNSPRQDSPIPCIPPRKHPGNPLWVQVALNGWRTYPVNPPSMMSHLFLARVHPLNHLRMFRLMRQNLRWLQHNRQKNLLVINRPTTSRSVIIINNTPIVSPSTPTLLPSPVSPRAPPPPPRCQAPLIPTMTLARNLLTYDQL
ncbi:hypothetical protein O181_043053 [Austropuccinia psidii MF-1]|uniref:Uncharacterized protein n=1 Tax=Austropuccinia psidii MF-1 TaxID=1389203 RepID=A0A9Q3DMB6_9BASI|nr:hypothetical protein [Austropuccinia psidii MF-1]